MSAPRCGEEQVYCGHMGEQRQRQGDLGESRVDRTTLRERGGGRPGTAARRTKGTRRSGQPKCVDYMRKSNQLSGLESSG